MGNNIAPRSDLDLHAQVGQDRRHIGNGLLQGQILAGDIGAPFCRRVQQQQGLRIGIQVCHFFDDKCRPGLHHFFYRAPLDGTQNSLPVLGRDIGGQLDLDLENLLVAIFRIDNIVLRKANVIGGNVARHAVQLDEVSRAQGR